MPASICRAPSMRGSGLAQVPVARSRGVAVAASASTLCFSISRWAWVIAASASCRLGLAASASSRAIRRSTGCGSSAPPVAGAPAGRPLADGVDPEAPADRLEGWGRARSGRGCPAPRRRTGGRSRASAPRAPPPRADPAPAAGTATACAASPCHWPSRASVSSSASTGRRSRPPKWFWLISSQVRPSARSSAASRAADSGGGCVASQPPDGRSAVAPAGCSASPSGEATR